MFLIISLLCYSVTSYGGEFENLYFEFCSKTCEISGETFSPDGKKEGTVTGKSSGAASADGKEFTEKFEYLFMPGKHEGKDTLIWKRGEDGVFRTTGKDAAGNKFTCVLTVKTEKEYGSLTTFEDGRTVETKAELNKDGVLHAVDTGKTKEGDVVFIIKYTRAKVAEDSNP